MGDEEESPAVINLSNVALDNDEIILVYYQRGSSAVPHSEHILLYLIPILTTTSIPDCLQYSAKFHVCFHSYKNLLCQCMHLANMLHVYAVYMYHSSL